MTKRPTDALQPPAEGGTGDCRARPAAAGRSVAGLAASRHGATAVEFALLLPVLLIIAMALIDLGTVIFNKMELMSAVRTGAQVALMDSSNTSLIIQSVTSSTNLSPTVTTSAFCECSDGTQISCSNTCADPLVNRTYMTITATETFIPITPRLIPGFPDSFDLSEQVTVRIQ